MALTADEEPTDIARPSDTAAPVGTAEPIASPQPATAQPPAPAHEEGDPRRKLILVLVLLGQFIVTASQGSVTIATTTIRSDLGATADDMQWLVVLYQIGYGLVLATSGRLGDIFGRKNVFLIGLTGFVLASVMAAAAPSMMVLIAARLLQGICGGLASPQVLAMIHVAFPPRERAKAFSAFSMLSGGGFVIGQLITGLMIDLNPFNVGWRNSFWLNVVVGVVVISLSFRFLRPFARVPDQRVDSVGAIVLAIASLLVLYPVIQGRSEGWPLIFFAMMLATIPVVWLLIKHFRRLTRHGRTPLIDLDVLRLRSFRAGLIVSAMFGFIAFPPFFLITVTLTQGFGEAPLTAAMLTSLGPVTTVIVASFSTRLMRRLGGRVFAASGAMSVICSVLLAGALIIGGDDPNLWLLVPGFICMGSIGGLSMPAAVTLTLSQVPPAKAATSSGMYQTAQQYVSPLGVAIFSVIYFGVLAGATDADAYIRATTWSFGFAIIFSIPLIIGGFVIERRGLFPAMHPK